MRTHGKPPDAKCLDDLRLLIHHDMEAFAFEAIPRHLVEYYQKPLHGWERTLEKFPLSVDHIEEASKCLAFGRNAGCVYNLIGIVQEVLEALGKKLAVTLDPNDTWNGLITKIANAIAANQVSSPKKQWKEAEPFYSEVLSDVKAIKNAWRNPTMHFRRTYSYEQAKKIYERVQEFAVHASTRLRGKRK